MTNTRGTIQGRAPRTHLERYLVAPIDRRAALLEDEALREEVRAWFGDPAFAAHEAASRSLASSQARAAPRLLLAQKPRNLVLVPGIMGSFLAAQLGGIWWLDLLRCRDKLNGLALSPDGSGDLDTAAGLEPCGIDVTYESFARKIVQSDSFGLEPFAFDWRRLPTTEAGRLRDVVNRLYAEHGKPIHLVGHSMGGLMVRATLMLHGDELWPKIGKVVFLGAPHYGSPSIAGYLKNHLWGFEELAAIGAFLSRQTFRSLWGALSLLPAPLGIYPDTRHGELEHPCANFDLYRAESYALDLDTESTAALQRVLDGCADLHRELFAWHDQKLAQEYKNRMLVIAGVGYKTLFRLEYDRKFWGIWEHMTKVTERGEGRHREGDGRVPLASAELEAVPRRYVHGTHSGLPDIPAVVADVFAWLLDQPLSLSETAAGALGLAPALAHQSATPAAAPSAAKTLPEDAYDRYREIGPERLAELVAELETGRLPGANLARLL